MDELTTLTQENAPEIKQELLAGKYKTPDDLVKGYKELEKKIGSFVGAPDEYSIPENIKHKELVDILSRKGKEINMSQGAFDQLITEYESAHEAKRSAFKEQLKKLDGEEKRTATEVITFLKNTLSAQDAERVSELITSMDDLKMFDQLRKAKTLTNSQGTMLVDEVKPQNMDDYLKTLDRKRLYGPKPDVAYRAEVNRRLKEYTGE